MLVHVELSELVHRTLRVGAGEGLGVERWKVHTSDALYGRGP